MNFQGKELFSIERNISDEGGISDMLLSKDIKEKVCLVDSEFCSNDKLEPKHYFVKYPNYIRYRFQWKSPRCLKHLPEERCGWSTYVFHVTQLECNKQYDCMYKFDRQIVIEE